MVEDSATLVSRKTMQHLSLILLMFGLGIWWSWGFYFGVWIDIGLYAVVAPIVAFGLVGLLLYSQKDLDAVEMSEEE